MTRSQSGAASSFAFSSSDRAAISRRKIRRLRSIKGLPVIEASEAFAGPEAPQMDFVFTVCDSAAGEACPIWPGHPATAHWGIEDPAAVEGSDLEKERAFVQAFKYLRNRIGTFISLPLSSLDAVSLNARLREIGEAEGTTAPRPRVA